MAIVVFPDPAVPSTTTWPSAGEGHDLLLLSNRRRQGHRAILSSHLADSSGPNATRSAGRPPGAPGPNRPTHRHRRRRVAPDHADGEFHLRRLRRSKGCPPAGRRAGQIAGRGASVECGSAAGPLAIGRVRARSALREQLELVVLEVEVAVAGDAGLWLAAGGSGGHGA